MDWLIANLGTIVVGLIVAAVITLIVVYLIRKKKSGH